MKTIIGIIAVAVMSTTAMAKNNELQNLDYYPGASKWKLSVGLATPLQSKEKAYITTNKTVSLAGSTYKGTDWKFGGEYGVTDKFRLGANMHYAYSNKRDDMGTSAKGRGFSDPTITANYTAYMTNDWFIAPTLSVTPSLIKAVMGGTGATTYGSDTSNYPGMALGGNRMNGGSTDFTVGSMVVYTKESCEFGASPWLTSKGMAKYTSKNTAAGTVVESKMETESMMMYGVDLNWRHHYNPTWFTQIGATVTGEYTSTTTSPSSTTTTNGVATTTTVTNPNKTKATTPLHATPAVSVGYKCPTTGMLVELGFNYDRYNVGGQSQTSTGSNNGLATTTEFTNLGAGLTLSREF